jgi:uridine kinase|tara:strand:+ start:1479 stop:2090 length:612 start_codon:yes stop_codon:yes gene_type:complete
MMKIIGVCGGSGSGKTTLVEAVREHLSTDFVSVISQDSYYKNHETLTFEERCELNYDHPNAIDYDLFVSHLNQLKEGKSIDYPIYSYSEHLRSDQFIEVFPKPVVLVEGILIFAHTPLREQFTTTIFIDAADDTRLRRRTVRDIRTRGRTAEEVKHRFEDTILPMHNAHIEPHKQTSDYIFDNNKDDLSRLGSFCKLVNKLIK